MQLIFISFSGQTLEFNSEKELCEHLSFYNPTMLSACAPQLWPQGLKVVGSGEKISVQPFRFEPNNEVIEFSHMKI